jgi:ArsR family transcriptional regulator
VTKLELDTAAMLLDELGNVTRLKIVRLLVRAGQEGLAVGEIQEELGTPGSTLSHHLSHLRTAGLIRQEREGTVLRCIVDFDKIDALVKFLTDECCVGIGRKSDRRRRVA